MALGTTHTQLYTLSSPLPPPHPLLTYSVFIHSTWGACRDDATYVLFMPHDQQQFVYEYLINPQLTHQWKQPPPRFGGATSGRNASRLSRMCQPIPSTSPSHTIPSITPSLRNLKCLSAKASASVSASMSTRATGECKTSWTHSHSIVSSRLVYTL